MGRKRQDDDAATPEKRKRFPVDLERELARKIGVIASWREVTVPQYVNQLLAPLVEEEFQKVVQEMGYQDQ